MARPLCAYIDLSALTHNLQCVQRLAPQSRVMAVVKANGYGHGVVPVAQALIQADAFAVASLGEALELRYAGITHPIILLEGLFSPEELQKAFQYQLDIVVHSDQQLEMLQDCQLGGQVHIWLKIDTGMHRLGFEPERVRQVYDQLCALPCVRQPIRVMTHFASADEPDDDLTVRQRARFDAGIQSLPTELPRSLANSAVVVNFPDYQADWIRPGIMLYGVSPTSAQSAEAFGLRPVMTLMSEVISLKQIEKGEYVGYAGSWQAERVSLIAIIAVGYGDGYPRHAPTGTPVRIRGRYAPLIGRVSMDMIAVDVTDIAGVQVGTSVTLWGRGLPVAEIAEYAHTISYELLCGITRRVPCYFQTPPVDDEH